MDAVRQNPIWLTCKPLQRMCNNRMQHITTIRSSLLMFPLTPDQHHWLDVATEDEGWCSFRSCTPSRSRARTCSNWKKTLAYLLVLPGSRARIVRCGGRYEPQLVKRSSEWVRCGNDFGFVCAEKNVVIEANLYIFRPGRCLLAPM